MPYVRRVLESAFIGVVLVGSLVSCAPGAASPLELRAADTGSRQTLGVGQQVKISLDSNPTTGYRWAIDGTLPPQLEQVGESDYAARSKAIGAGGVEVWTFIGKSTGAGTLRLKYWRSFEPTAAPARNFEVGVEVRQP
jgi:inhibitor of cysteine peptidase